jgi:hypothetical protein
MVVVLVHMGVSEVHMARTLGVVRAKVRATTGVDSTVAVAEAPELHGLQLLEVAGVVRYASFGEREEISLLACATNNQAQLAI